MPALPSRQTRTQASGRRAKCDGCGNELTQLGAVLGFR
jgi:hypothetical protein